MVSVEHNDALPPSLSEDSAKSSNLIDDASDIIKIFVVFMVACSFCIFIFIFNLALVCGSQLFPVITVLNKSYHKRLIRR